MTDKILIDTNILVYAYVPQDLIKQSRAVTTLASLGTEGTGVLSTQTLSEFYVTVTSTRKYRHPMTPHGAKDIIQDFVETWPVIEISPLIVFEAIRGVQAYSMSYWDAQIWAVAKLNQVPIIYSEDGPTDSTIEGVRYVNPLIGPKLFVVKEQPPVYKTKRKKVRTPSTH